MQCFELVSFGKETSNLNTEHAGAFLRFTAATVQKVFDRTVFRPKL
jgi:hypothetical protein